MYVVYRTMRTSAAHKRTPAATCYRQVLATDRTTVTMTSHHIDPPTTIQTTMAPSSAYSRKGCAIDSGTWARVWMLRHCDSSGHQSRLLGWLFTENRQDCFMQNVPNIMFCHYCCRMWSVLARLCSFRLCNPKFALMRLFMNNDYSSVM